MVKKQSLLLIAGTCGNIPVTHLYNTSQILLETIMQRITFAGKNSFETMFFQWFSQMNLSIFNSNMALKVTILQSQTHFSFGVQNGMG
jgi:hypothetical protein